MEIRFPMRVKLWEIENTRFKIFQNQEILMNFMNHIVYTLYTNHIYIPSIDNFISTNLTIFCHMLYTALVMIPVKFGWLVVDSYGDIVDIGSIIHGLTSAFIIDLRVSLNVKSSSSTKITTSCICMMKRYQYTFIQLWACLNVMIGECPSTICGMENYTS